MTAVLPYNERPGWQDITPIAQEEALNAMAVIQYNPDYQHSMDAFRYILTKNERSQRAIQLTETILKLNPGMFTVWNYRTMLLTSSGLDVDLNAELDLMEALIKVHLKGYQVWQHRKLIVLALNDPSRELAFCSRALQIDSKNYHTWAYRHWALCHFYSLQNDSFYPLETKKQVWEAERTYSESLISEDARNNSAWAHRFFVCFENGVYEDVSGEELEFAKEKLMLAPNNASAWNYLRGVLKRSGKGLASCLDFARDLKSGSPCALTIEFQADALAEKGEREAAAKLYDQVAEIDPIRAPFYALRKSKLSGQRS